MKWLSQLAQFVRGGTTSGLKGQPDLSLICYAKSDRSVGAHVYRCVADIDANKSPIAHLAAYRSEDELAHGSILFYSADATASGMTFQVLDLASRFLRQNFDWTLAACDMSIQRSKPLRETSPLNGGLINVADWRLEDGAGRYLVRWISAENHAAGRLDDEHHLLVATVDVVCNVLSNGSERHTGRYVNIAVFHRCDFMGDEPLDSTWKCVAETVGEEDVTAVAVIEAVPLPMVSGIVTI